MVWCTYIETNYSTFGRYSLFFCYAENTRSLAANSFYGSHPIVLYASHLLIYPAGSRCLFAGRDEIIKYGGVGRPSAPDALRVSSRISAVADARASVP